MQRKQKLICHLKPPKTQFYNLLETNATGKQSNAYDFHNRFLPFCSLYSPKLRRVTAIQMLQLCTLRSSNNSKTFSLKQLLDFFNS